MLLQQQKRDICGESSLEQLRSHHLTLLEERDQFTFQIPPTVFRGKILDYSVHLTDRITA